MKIYRLFDYVTGHYVGDEFDNASKFFEYHFYNTFNTSARNIADSLRSVSQPIHVIEHYIFGRFQIKDELGETYKTPIDIWIKAISDGVSFIKYKDWSSYHNNFTYRWDRPLSAPKKNINKIKHQFYNTRYYRNPRIKQELTANSEADSKFIRGKRKNLHLYTRSYWHSIKSYDKSWKHNSRRKKQWKEIIDTQNKI